MSAFISLRPLHHVADQPAQCGLLLDREIFEYAERLLNDLDDLDWPKLTSAMNLLRKSKIFIDETPALSPSELRARARRLKREHDIGMIVVDYLQLMGSGPSSGRRDRTRS